MKPFETLAEASAPGGAKLSLHRRDGDFFLRVDGVELMSTRRHASERRLAECVAEPLAARPPSAGPVRLLIGGLGLGFSLVRALELLPAHAEVEVVELLPEIVAWNREHLAETTGAALADPRVTVHVGDVVEHIAKSREKSFDGLVFDVDNGPGALVSPANQRLYGAPGLAAALRVLVPGGRAAYWSARHEPRFEARLVGAGFLVGSEAAKTHPSARRSSHRLYVAERRQPRSDAVPPGPTASRRAPQS
ncbi:MAG: spermine synthase [Planctomycetaceae bacterium]|nr:spermine synthase [Planctomycetaceae bacterium]